MARLFTPFFTTKAEAGTGLGLATARHTIDEYGGGISVQSVYGQGTTFLIKLPLASMPPDQTEKVAAATAGRKLTILAVDDMDSTLTVLRFGLEADNHSVLTARSGEEACEKFRANPI